MHARRRIAAAGKTVLPRLARRAVFSSSVERVTDWYRLGAGSLGVDSEDGPIAERFATIFGACATPVPGEGPRVTCQVRRRAGTVAVRFEDPEPLDEAGFVEAIFPERGYLVTRDADGSRIRLPGTTHDLRIADGALHAPAESPWQPLVANLAVSRLLRLQRDLVFFHAASVAVNGRGVMACGPKRSGKTTLALGLAARGHQLLGDEVAALRTTDRVLLPFPRSIGYREGPRSDGAEALLARSPGTPELYPDGETRTRITYGQVQPGAPPAATPLTTLLILHSIVPSTRVVAASARAELLGAIPPLAASLWGRPAGAVAVRLLAMLSAVRIHEIESGPPDEVVDRVEQLMEDG